MKVAILGTAYPFRGGLAAYNERMAKEMLVQGDQVKIYTFSLQYPAFLFPGTSQYSSLPAPKDLDIEVCVNSINPFNWIKTGLKIRKWKPDILIVKFWLPFMAPCLGTICKIVRTNKHTKVIAVLDNIIPHEHRIGDKLFTQYFVNSVDGFIAMSNSVYNDINYFDNKKQRLLYPHPLYDNYGSIIDKSEAKKQLGLDIHTNYLLFFGLIRDYKGLDILLKAFALLKNKLSNTKLIIAGDYYANKEEYEQLFDTLKIKQDLELHTQFIPDDEVNKFFCAADVVVQPYKTATQSGVTQICYHFNKPMIVTNVGGLPEIVPHNKVGLVVEPNEIAVADAILQFYQEAKEIEFINNILIEKEKYSWNTLCTKIKQLAE
ncbi:MAG: glycosyltransferase family 4 protein [Chitinophagales bacterium]|nr:glycosyltransferase family 4 protein [Chitinophagales bacterium]